MIFVNTQQSLLDYVNSFLTFSPCYNDKQPHLTGGPNFYWRGGGEPLSPTPASYGPAVVDTKQITKSKCVLANY